MEKHERHDYVPVTVAAAKIGVTVKHVYRLIAEELLDAIDISTSGAGGSQSYRVSKKSIQDFIETRKISPEKAILD